MDFLGLFVETGEVLRVLAFGVRSKPQFLRLDVRHTDKEILVKQINGCLLTRFARNLEMGLIYRSHKPRIAT